MTREEAIKFLKGYLDEEVYTDKCRTAHNMAIKALDQEPCEDCVSRQAIDQNIYDYAESNRLSYANMKNAILDVAEHKKGKWIYDKTIQNWRCSECNETPKTLGFVGTADFMVEHFRFCNHCGAEMESEE